MGFSNNILFSFLDVNEIEKTYSNWWISSWNEGSSLESIFLKKINIMILTSILRTKIGAWLKL